MKKLLLLFLVLVVSSANAEQNPDVNIYLDSNQSNLQVYYKEKLRIPIEMSYWMLNGSAQWHIPGGFQLEGTSGACPPIPFGWLHFNNAETKKCSLNLVYLGNDLGKVITTNLAYSVITPQKHHTFRHRFESFPFTITVVPHPLSMSNINEQQATANQDFYLNLKPYVKYFDENAVQNKIITGKIVPESQNGLYFDQKSFSIVGKPEQIGTVVFHVGAKNQQGETALIPLTIHIKANIKDKPVFKKDYRIASAVANKHFRLNLMDLIEPNTSFMATNQVTFMLKPNANNPSWLNISQADGLSIEGLVPKNLAGQELSVTLIAHSNSGGDSEPFTLNILVANDPEQKPIVQFFKLEHPAGTSIDEDLARYISDPVQDASLKIVLDNIEPQVSWVSVSELNPTTLNVQIPEKASGQLYHLTLHANTLIGGDSEAVVIPLQVSIDKSKIPRLDEYFTLPILFPMQSYQFDFTTSTGIKPNYTEEPFTVSFAKDYTHPNWLYIHNNQLVAEATTDLEAQEITLYLEIKNTAGGSSGVIPVKLQIMN